jgi:hypothetical protein
VVVRDRGDAIDKGQCIGHIGAEQGGRAYPHRGTVAVAVVRPEVRVPDPLPERAAIAAFRIAQAPPAQRRCRLGAAQQRIGQRHRAHRVIGEVRVLAEQREPLRAMISELVDRADEVADDGAEHERIGFAAGGRSDDQRRAGADWYRLRRLAVQQASQQTTMTPTEVFLEHFLRDLHRDQPGFDSCLESHQTAFGKLLQESCFVHRLGWSCHGSLVAVCIARGHLLSSTNKTGVDMALSISLSRAV